MRAAALRGACKLCLRRQAVCARVPPGAAVGARPFCSAKGGPGAPRQRWQQARDTRARVAAWTALTFMGCCLPVCALLFSGREDLDDVKQKLVEQGVYDPTLPKPGDIVHLDYRSPEAIAAASHPDETRPLRVVQWNIERGYELDAVKTTLAELDADILLLQEIDVGCDRSDNRDVGGEIAAALQMNYVFVCEFTELRSLARARTAQGGGVHGNAVLTRLNVEAAEVISHQHHPIDWAAGEHQFAKREPREGQRLTLAVRVATATGPLQLYSAHLEVFCGAVGRLQQFSDVLEHSRAAAAAGVAQQIVGGDLNTLAHGIARLSPFHCTDHLRWTTLGQTEAEFWKRNLFDVPDDEGAPGRNERLWAAGIRDESLCADLRNPGFSEVFPVTEPTLDNPNYRVLGVPLMTGKLDWLLYRGPLVVTDSVMGNHDYAASDHKWLAADFRACGSGAGKAALAAAGSSPRLPALSESGAASPKVGAPSAISAASSPRALTPAALPLSPHLPHLGVAAQRADSNAAEDTVGLLEEARAEAGLLGRANTAMGGRLGGLLGRTRRVTSGHGLDGDSALEALARRSVDLLPRHAALHRSAASQ